MNDLTFNPHPLLKNIDRAVRSSVPHRFLRKWKLAVTLLALFVSPFVLVFAVSVFFLTHAWLPQLTSESLSTRVASSVVLPANLLTLSGRPLIEALTPTLQSLDVPGEIGFIQHRVQEQILIIPVTVPGRETTVSISLATHVEAFSDGVLAIIIGTGKVAFEFGRPSWGHS